MFYVGIDLGTSETKCLVISEKGKILARTSVAVSCELRPGGVAELDPEIWWNSAREAVRTALSGIARPSDRAAVAISSQGLSFVLLDEKDGPLGLAISTLDTRAGSEAEELSKVISEDQLFNLTGKRANPYYLLPKLLWLQRHRAGDLQKAKRFALAMDYVSGKLIGKAAPTDHALASGSALHDVRALKWIDSLIELFRLDRGIFPAVAPAGLPVGDITPEAAEAFGLPQKTTVVTGSQDQKCAAFAAGLQQDISTLSLGTAAAVEFIAPEPVLDAYKRLPCFPYVEAHSWLLEGVLPTAGGAVNWFMRILSASQESISRLEAEAREADWKATPFFAPHLGGAGSPHWEPSAQGSFWGLSLATRRGEMFRSVLEGICFEIQANMLIARQLGFSPKLLKVFGGGARNHFWLQLMADVLKAPVCKLALTDAAAYGACLLAARGGAEQQLPLAEIECVFEPEAATSAIVQERHEKYLHVQEKVFGAPTEIRN